MLLLPVGCIPQLFHEVIVKKTAAQLRHSELKWLGTNAVWKGNLREFEGTLIFVFSEINISLTPFC